MMVKWLSILIIQNWSVTKYPLTIASSIFLFDKWFWIEAIVSNNVLVSPWLNSSVYSLAYRSLNNLTGFGDVDMINLDRLASIDGCIAIKFSYLIELNYIEIERMIFTLFSVGIDDSKSEIHSNKTSSFPSWESFASSNRSRSCIFIYRLLCLMVYLLFKSIFGNLGVWTCWSFHQHSHLTIARYIKGK